MFFYKINIFQKPFPKLNIGSPINLFILYVMELLYHVMQSYTIVILWYMIVLNEAIIAHVLVSLDSTVLRHAF